MKNLKSSLLFATLIGLAALAPPARGQTNTPIIVPNVPGLSSGLPASLESQQDFVQSAFGYFTSFNSALGGTNGPFSASSPYEAWIGAAYQSGVNLGAQLGIEANPFTGAPGLTLGEVSTFAPQVGTIADEEFDIGWSFTHIDTRVLFAGAAAYCFGSDTEANKGIKGGILAEVQKALTKNTFGGTRFEALFGSGKGNQLIISLEAGATF